MEPINRPSEDFPSKCCRSFEHIKKAAKRPQQQRAPCMSKPRFSSFKLSHLMVTSFLILLVAICVVPQQQVDGSKKLKKAAKSIAKGLVLSKLTSRKNFLPVPLPIPVPIEINEPPVYLKGKPKYVNVYQPAPKTTPQPVIKPTTVYHMPVYSPTYEYMSMDPMSMYAGSAMVGMYPRPMADIYNSEGVKSSINADLTSSNANFNDYDDESGQYYVRKSAARRRKYAPSGTQDYDTTLSRADGTSSTNEEDDSAEFQADNEQQQVQHLRDHLLAVAAAREHANRISNGETTILVSPTDHVGNSDEHRRTKRQVYYQSGYNGQERCQGFPLEINVRSRIKMDQIFPIHGKSQIKKCIPVGKPLFPPVRDEHY